ncbi:FMN-binding domain protein [uncultured spirochete]|jgi:Na+-transporting NADH:ubiquinone oxidoreductase, subunit NqrC|uniref:FMN-binding domain protein n=2 Tax=Spirochaetales TaxID=136 RepID=A0A3P3XJI5_9SPIR|nr:FMN-binding domain protein [uncultured spirochete]
MKLNRNSVIYAAVFTFVVCVAFVIILAIANQVTLARVNANKRLESRTAVLKAFGLADSTTPSSEIDSKYTQLVTEKSVEKATAYTATIDGQTYVAVKLTMPGLWGPITAVLATDPAGTVVRGFEIVDQQETPGLGGRISEPWFSAQFKGKKVLPDGTIAFEQGSGKGNFDPNNGTVDAITGASRTSDFVRALVNRSLALARQIGGTL